MADDAGLVRVDAQLLEAAAAIADDDGISVYAAAYVAAARAVSGQLVSCDVRDLHGCPLGRHSKLPEEPRRRHPRRWWRRATTEIACHRQVKSRITRSSRSTSLNERH